MDRIGFVCIGEAWKGRYGQMWAGMDRRELGRMGPARQIWFALAREAWAGGGEADKARTAWAGTG